MGLTELVTNAAGRRRVDMEYRQGDIDSLARKRAVADLTNGEIAVLDALVEP